MRRSRLPLTALRAFEAAGRHQSFKSAADELAVSEAAISRQVRDLERSLGMALFHRQHRAVRLNDSGQQLLAELTRGFDIIDAALSKAVPSLQTRNITVSVEPTFASLLLVPRLAGFLDRHPDITVNIEVDTALADLRSGGPELAIRHSIERTSWPRSEARRLLDVRLTPMMAPAAQPGTHFELSDLAGMKLLQDENGDAWTHWLSAAGVTGEMLWGPVYSNEAVALQSAELGQGIALCSRSMAAHLLEKGSLMAPFDLEVENGAYWFLVRDFRKLTDAQKLFFEWLVREVGEIGHST